MLSILGFLPCSTSEFILSVFSSFVFLIIPKSILPTRLPKSTLQAPRSNPHLITDSFGQTLILSATTHVVKQHKQLLYLLTHIPGSQHLWPAGNVGHVHTGRASSIASASAPRTTTVRSGSRGRKAAWAFVAKTAIAKRLRSFMTAAVWAGEIGERVERSGGGNS